MALGRTEIEANVAAATDLPRTQVTEVLRAFEKEVTKALVAGDSVRLPGFLTLETAIRSARQGRNPSTGETIEIAEARVVKISAGAPLKKAVKEG
jgi:DNA-binding protein HU-beta